MSFDDPNGRDFGGPDAGPEGYDERGGRRRRTKRSEGLFSKADRKLAEFVGLKPKKKTRRAPRLDDAPPLGGSDFPNPFETPMANEPRFADLDAPGTDGFGESAAAAPQTPLDAPGQAAMPPQVAPAGQMSFQEDRSSEPRFEQTGYQEAGQSADSAGAPKMPPLPSSEAQRGDQTGQPAFRTTDMPRDAKPAAPAASSGQASQTGGGKPKLNVSFGNTGPAGGKIRARTETATAPENTAPSGPEKAQQTARTAQPDQGGTKRQGDPIFSQSLFGQPSHAPKQAPKQAPQQPVGQAPQQPRQPAPEEPASASTQGGRQPPQQQSAPTRAAETTAQTFDLDAARSAAQQQEAQRSAPSDNPFAPRTDSFAPNGADSALDLGAPFPGGTSEFDGRGRLYAEDPREAEERRRSKSSKRSKRGKKKSSAQGGASAAMLSRAGSKTKSLYLEAKESFMELIGRRKVDVEEEQADLNALMAQTANDAGAENGKTLSKSLSKPVTIGAAVVIGLFGVGGVWAATAPIAASALAPGKLSPEGSRRTVQHFEGGIVQEIHARNGDTVQAGDPLIVLEKDQASAQFNVYLGQKRVLEATRSRLISEQGNLDEVRFNQWLLDQRNEPEVKEILHAQRELFETRRQTHTNRKNILRQRIGQLKEEISGNEAQITNQRRQIALLEEEIADLTTLVDKGLSPKTRLLALKRQSSEVRERMAANESAIARSRQAINETELQINTADSERLDQIGQELNRVMGELATVNERWAASRDVLERTVIRAPVSGRIVGSKVKTIGGVVGRGEPLMDIVPGEERLVIEAKLAPQDGPYVEPGQSVNVMFPAFSMRTTPRIHGTVKGKSADVLLDEQSGISYYAVTVEVPIEEIARLGPENELQPGMDAQVQIVTGQRTVLGYLLAPLESAMFRAFKEVR